MKRKSLFQLIIIFFLIFTIYGYENFLTDNFSNSSKTKDFDFNIPIFNDESIINFSNNSSLNFSINPYILALNESSYFITTCSDSPCLELLLYFISQSSSSIDCAFYDINLIEIVNLMQEKSDSGINVRLVIDKDNYDDSLSEFDFLKLDTKSSYMHNKFCIFDKQLVLTGSWNPTFRGTYKNDNDIVYIHNKILASRYETEFEELWRGEFGAGEKESPDSIILNNSENLTVNSYFCPDDWCANRILEVLDNANESINFATFSFTHDDIGDFLVKKHNEGIKITGIFEKSQNSKYSEFSKLLEAGINVTWDSNPANMHHKYFIVDNKILITGSMNPSKNGDTRNDENLLILESNSISFSNI